MNKRFTLLELLVVIAIIGILVTILVPSLVKARQAAFQGVCASNMKQIGYTHFTYSVDSNAYVPPASNLEIGASSFNGSNDNVTWDDAMMDYVGYELSVSEKNREFLKVADHPDFPRMFHCPADPIIEGQNGGIRRSYSMSEGKPKANHKLRGMGGKLWSTRISMPDGPSLTALNIETDHKNNRMGKARYAAFEKQQHLDPTYIGNPNGKSETFGLHRPGSGKYNYLFVDGHVAFHNVLNTNAPGQTTWGPHNGIMTIDADDNPDNL
ncbi:MAG: prepilin-type N-terminal cleavage/methylation domain-containing protein [Lentisphaerales bacterium]|nr:prepilin-type N-terminal cleavage/methylation domain-containing protein [Lentisphaerales bacterium]